MTKILLFFSLLVAVTINIRSQETKPDYGLKPSGALFSRWEWNQGGAGIIQPSEKDANQFAIERFYLTMRGMLSEDISFRGTLDVYGIAGSDIVSSSKTTSSDTADKAAYTTTTTNSTSASNLNAMIQLKYAYFDWKAASWLTFRGGMQMTEWIDYVEGLWRYRGIAKVLIDDRGLNSSSDLGLSAIIKLPSKMGEVQVGVYNGPTFRKAENNRFKDIAARLVVTPLSENEGVLKNLQVAGHFYTGNTALGLSRSRFGALVALPSDNYNICAEWESASDDIITAGVPSTVKASGISIFGELKARSFTEDLGSLSLVARYDMYNPNTELADAGRIDANKAKFSKLIAGFSYKIASPVTVVLNLQQTKYGTEGAASGVLTKYNGEKTDSNNMIFVHFIVSL